MRGKETWRFLSFMEGRDSVVNARGCETLLDLFLNQMIMLSLDIARRSFKNILGNSRDRLCMQNFESPVYLHLQLI